MASNLLKLPLHKINSPAISQTPFPTKLYFQSTPFPTSLQLPTFSLCSSGKHTLQLEFRAVPPEKNSDHPPTPTTKEEAINQAKTCLAAALEKPLNNPRLVGKLKKLKQPRFRVEIPVIDHSPESLAEKVFGTLSVKRKGTPAKILIFWPEPPNLAELALNSVKHTDLSTVQTGESKSLYGSSDVAVFVAPVASQLGLIESVCKEFDPKPVVIFNPKWDFEEESGFEGMGGFVASFEVVYSFMGLEVRGVLSRRKGVVFRCVKDGVASGGGWLVLVEEKGEMTVVSRFKKRPSVAEVENVLYNLMAVNSPVTKSVKFVKDLVSRVGGTKQKL